MIRKDQPLKLVITEDGSPTLFNPNLNETYHSLKGALAESHHVFINAGLKFIIDQHKLAEIQIFEVGFGTGLNAFLTMNKLSDSGKSGMYQAVETQPLSEDIYTKLNYFEGEEYERYQRMHRVKWNQPVEMIPGFVLSKYDSSLEEYNLPENSFDLIYYDAFAPSRQPEIWAVTNLKKCFKGLKPGGVFVTYCAQGQFKRDMISLGFDVHVIPGALGKKEMVRAIKP